MKVLILLLALSFAPFGWSQSSSEKYNTNSGVNSEMNIHRYKKDYELVDETVLGSDSTILNLIDLKSMEYLRHLSSDQVCRDQINGIAILLYSENRMKNGDNHIDTIAQ